MIIGVANIIPGVSGGTMALVLGIYERLINSIHNISIDTAKAVLALLKFNKSSLDKFSSEMKRIDAVFLFSLLIGAMISIVALAKVMTYFLEHFHDQTYGFFCGLVIVSAWVPFKLIKKHTLVSIVAALIAITGLVAFSSSVTDDQKISKAQAKYEMQLQKVTESGTAVKESFDHSPSRQLYMVLAGAIGISAMILPGISGSFLLLLMGVYFSILKSISQFDILTLFSFSIGCLIGVMACTRLINYALKKWYDITMSFLLGLVIGSLVAIWPFKESTVVGDEVIYLSNKLPAALGTNELFTILAAVTGGLIVLVFIIIENKNAVKKV